MPHVSLAVPAQHHTLLPKIAGGGAEAARARDIRLSDLGNGELPSNATLTRMGEDEMRWTPMRMVAALLLVVGSCVAYWTFGRPVFGSVSRQGAGPAPAPTTVDPSRPKTDWNRVNRILSKSYG